MNSGDFNASNGSMNPGQQFYMQMNQSNQNQRFQQQQMNISGNGGFGMMGMSSMQQMMPNVGMNDMNLSNMQQYAQMMNMPMNFSQSAPLQRVDHFRTFDGNFQSLNNRETFDKVLNQYLTQRQINLQQLPPICGKSLDLFMIFHKVVQQGGYETLQAMNLWAYLLSSLGYDSGQSSQNIIQKTYFVILNPIEQKAKSSLITTQPQISSPMQGVSFNPHGIPQAIQNQQFQTGQLNMINQFGQSSQSSPSIGSTQMNIANMAHHVVQQQQIPIAPPTPILNQAQMNTNMSNIIPHAQMQGPSKMQQTPTQQARVHMQGLNVNPLGPGMNSNVTQPQMQIYNQTQPMNILQSPPTNQSQMQMNSMSPIQSQASQMQYFPNLQSELNQQASLNFLQQQQLSQSPQPPPQVIRTESTKSKIFDPLAQFTNTNANFLSIPTADETSIDAQEETPVEVKEEDLKSVKEEIENEELEDGDQFVPIVRNLTAFGGYELAALGSSLQRMKPSPEDYSPKNLELLLISLKSGLDLEVRYSLDQLLIHSGTLKYAECPQLLNSLIGFMFETIDLCYGHGKHRLYNYQELYELENLAVNVLQSNCVTTIDEDLNLHSRAVVVSMILRNTSLTVENIEIMGKHPSISDLILRLLNLPLSESVQNYFDHGDFATSIGIVDQLEHRKNAMIILSNIGLLIQIPNLVQMQLVVDISTDFIAQQCNVYTAVEMLAKTFIVPGNQKYLGDLENLDILIENLMKHLPMRAFGYDTSQIQMALYELILLIISYIVTGLPLNHGFVKKIANIGGFQSLMLCLSKRAPFHPSQRLSLELLQQFWSVRERALRSYLVCAKVNGISKLRHQELILMMALAQRDGDRWMPEIIMDFLLDYE